MDKNRKVKKGRNGLGIFAAKNFQPAQIIVEITGNPVHWEKLLNIGGIILDNAFRFDENHYLSPDGIGNYLNHSCDPNVGIIKKNNRLFLKSIRGIKSGEEIAFDYSTLVGDDDIWTMKCNCGAKTCRKRIKNFGSLPVPTKDRYRKAGVVPSFIEK